jgi:cellobiose phosphorylase
MSIEVRSAEHMGAQATAGLPARSPPQVALLSNGRYCVMMTDAGTGASTCQGLDVTRWREDATSNSWGQFCYVRDRTTDDVWSIGRRPLGSPDGEYEFAFHSHMVEFHHREGDLETNWSVCVVPDLNAEVRAVTIQNHGDRPRDLEITSYAEVCLNHRAADQAHPAFAKLFLETRFDEPTGALLARRRPRGAKEKPIYAVHLSTSSEPSSSAIEYETDRVRFLGRGRTPANPAAMDQGSILSGTTGPVLDPIFSLRRRLHLEPGETGRIAFITGFAETREEAIAIAERFRNQEAVEEAFAAALTATEKEQQEFSITPSEVDLFNRLAGAVVFTHAGLRDLDAVSKNQLGQPGLWPHAISGDLPIVLLHVTDDADAALIHELMKWHAYIRRRGLTADLVVLDKRASDSSASMKKEIEAAGYGAMVGKPGGLFLVEGGNISAEDATLIAAAARVVLGPGRGALADHLDVPTTEIATPPALSPKPAIETSPSAAMAPPDDLVFWNGLGGFRPDGRQYIVVVDGKSNPILPPAPWANVIANPTFGCLVTEAGLGYTWAGNSQTNRLTPWSNDPSADQPGEVVYLRDEESGDVWTPTPLPRFAGSATIVEHGQGYSRYRHQSRGLQQEILVFVPPEDPVKIVHVKLGNEGDKLRRLSATYYAEWVLGSHREKATMNVVTERDEESGAILARNAWASDFGKKIAFAASGPMPRSATADRTEFLGVGGDVSNPAALRRVDLAGRFGASLDPCAAMTTEITLAPGESKEVVFVLGQADDLKTVRNLVRTYTDSVRVSTAHVEVVHQWDQILQTVQVSTPDAGVNVMINRWLLYQSLVCRIWARSAFYQSGGAYGFRDQLQDVMALVYSDPEEARAHILRASARQFEEGDVQHWWHPPSGAGVRTRITDDLYFLPLVVHHYVTTTGDVSLLDERVAFISSPVLGDDQEEVFNVPNESEQLGSIYEHCERALERGYRLGEHQLPLMGTGDWNDGMNKVGAEGKGESVWNGWFFVSVLNAFADLAGRRGDETRKIWCTERAEALRSALEANAWDGAWYRRAYFDDGTPLGSKQNDECQIDGIPQAWAVISGVADKDRTRSAMNAVHQRLVRPDDKLIQLFDPPFDKGALQPGYIKGYVPGIRENGGQYTHAATWVVLATALQGDGDRALELWNLINPVYHALTREDVQRYKVEPYVVCADVYGAPPHSGRGGWTWYTGSASWLYRVALESILGFKRSGDSLRVDPCIPRAWKRFDMTYKHATATYRIQVDNPVRIQRGVKSTTLDGVPLLDGIVPLRDDGVTHDVRVLMG